MAAIDVSAGSEVHGRGCAADVAPLCSASIDEAKRGQPAAAPARQSRNDAGQIYSGGLQRPLPVRHAAGGHPACGMLGRHQHRVPQVIRDRSATASSGRVG
jgi:hypothetical protein